MLAALALLVLQDAPEPADYMDAMRAADTALVAGELTAARASFEACLTFDPENATATYGLACVAAREGRVDAAFELLASARARGYAERLLPRWDPDLAGLRADPRFAAWSAGAPEPATGAVRRELFVPLERARETGVAAIGVDGTRIAVPWPSGDIQLLDAESGAEVGVLRGHAAEVRRVIYAPDGGTLVSYDAEGELRFWDVASGACRLRRAAPRPATNILRSRIPLLAWVDGGRLLVSHGASGLRVWGADGAPLGELAGEGPFAWCAEARWIARAAGRTVSLFDARALGAPVGEPLPVEWPICGLALDRAGRRLAVGTEKGDALVFDVAERRKLWSTNVSDAFEQLRVPELCFSPDGELLAFSTTTLMEIHVHEVESGQRLARHHTNGGRMGGIMSVAFGGAGTHLYMDCTTTPGLCITRRGAPAGKELRSTEWAPDLDIDVSDPELSVRSFYGSGTSVLEDATAVELWRRHELEDGTFMLQTPEGYFSGTTRDLTGLGIMEKRAAWRAPKRTSLVSVAPRLFDPKRVRAALAGVRLGVPGLWD